MNLPKLRLRIEQVIRALMKRIFYTNPLLKRTIVIFSIATCLFACFAYSSGFAQTTQKEAGKTRPPTRLTPTVVALEEARKSVVCIEGDRIEPQDISNSNGKDGDYKGGKAFNGMGTGVIIDSRGYIVTNYHVIDGIKKLQVTTADKEVYVGIQVARDPLADLALIKIDGKGKSFDAIKLGVSADVIWAEEAHAIGDPYGYDFTLTSGRISGLDRDVPVDYKLTYPKAIQTSVPINPGNSGGPLLNNDGEMIGINCAIRSGAECIAFAIPVDQVVEVVSRMIQQQTNRVTYHGMRVKPSDGQDRIIVDLVEPDSPADRAGIQADDTILVCNDIEVSRTLDFSRSFLELKGTGAFNLLLERDGETIESTIQLSGPKRAGSQIASVKSGSGPVGVTVPPSPKYTSKADPVWDYFGIKYTPMKPDTYKRQYSKYLQDYPYGAIMVSAVRPNSPMSVAGIEAGDMIFGINGWITASEDDVMMIVATLKEESPEDNQVRILLNRTLASGNEPPNTHYETFMELP